ncbi:cyclohexanecarboxylate-CoA ligase [Acinetobacter rudis]|uniref:Cyclohexanecarboxylate-CoA ligase n=1 Tax=Acinetobacter rudis CIP 110305 TaxID=421052 RepID=S3NMQ1_9GAMM|nr:cyclohexanecarboxylate-CoA ligase [Acinetobacter rudis]EPF75569.1 cyclohexanecarboxylate-CoA ligase [Acinetobacter rudis CIP 110305]
MEFDAVLLPPRRERMLQHGYWLNKTILQFLDEAVRCNPDKQALVSYKAETQTEQSFSYQDILTLSNKMALGLKQLGVKKNDVVSCQLPNWWEFSLLYIACRRIGAVFNPLMPIFRERELSFMLQHCESKVFIVAKQFKKFDHEQLAYKLKDSLEHLEHVVVIDGQGSNSFAALLLDHHLDQDPAQLATLQQSVIGPDDVAQIIFTSGTTGEPKGVMHTANTLFANLVPYAQRLHLNDQVVELMSTPLAHQTGFLYGVVMPIYLNAKVVLQDIWDADKAIELIEKHQVTYTKASTPFLNDLAEAALLRPPAAVQSLKTFVCVGAPIPPALVKKARQNLQANIISAWGMSETGGVATTLPEDQEERAFNTDGVALPGVEIKIIDAQGQLKGVNQPGRLVVRACSNFGGYLKRPHLNDTDFDDWFDSGDIAYQDEQGYIRICGRNKDVIIRGGENIPVMEIESLLYQHPDIALVALVAYPDERLGERACAVVKLKQPDRSLSLKELTDFLKNHQLAMQYLPERLEIMHEFPMTASGKIQKFKLRELFA